MLPEGLTATKLIERAVRARCPGGSVVRRMLLVSQLMLSGKILDGLRCEDARQRVS